LQTLNAKNSVVFFYYPMIGMQCEILLFEPMSWKEKEKL
jgi:hypothetical protein